MSKLMIAWIKMGTALVVVPGMISYLLYIALWLGLGLGTISFSFMLLWIGLFLLPIFILTALLVILFRSQNKKTIIGLASILNLFVILTAAIIFLYVKEENDVSYQECLEVQIEYSDMICERGVPYLIPIKK